MHRCSELNAKFSRATSVSAPLVIKIPLSGLRMIVAVPIIYLVPKATGG